MTLTIYYFINYRLIIMFNTHTAAPVFVLCAMAFGVSAAGAAIENIDFSKVRIQDPFWSPRLNELAANTIPHCIDQIENKTLRMGNFINAAAGRGKHSGLCYDDSDVYKAMEGMAYSLVNNPDPALERKLEEWINLISKAQWDDGYLNTYYTIAADTPRWTNMIMHEMYCGGHLFEAAVAYYTATGKRALLDVAVRFADQMMQTFGPGKRHWVPGHEEIELALVRLADATGNKKYLDFARWLLEERGHGHGSYGNDTPWNAVYCQDDRPVRQITDVTGHAVRAMYLYCGMADVAARMPDTDYLTALRRVWDDVAERNMYITGGIGSSVKNEGFTEDYDLPNREAYCETCASVGLIMWAARMNRLTQDVKYVDVLERTLYNAALAGVQLGGQRFFYVNPLESAGGHHRQEWYGTACCPSNISRFLPSLGNYIYGLDDRNIYVNLFIGNHTVVDIDGVATELSISGGYPFEGDVMIKVRPHSPVSRNLRLRIPEWCEKYNVKVNGKDSGRCAGSGYLTIPMSGGGVEVALHLDMPVKVVAADPRVKENLDKLAVTRGPVVYCMEECDNMSGYDKACIGKNQKFSVSRGTGVLKDFVTLRTYAGNDTLTFVPYFAWDNRQPGKMKVWITEADPVYLNPEAPIEDRVEDALHRMTLEEKVKMLHAQSKFSSSGVPRLGIPEVWFTDGPHGVRPEVYWDEWNSAQWTNDSCTAFPALTCLAATWRPELALEYGKAIGEEARYRRKDVLLGPGVNIMRTPLCGRSFEYMGEDPILTSRMVKPYIQGLQSNNVAACVKHFALNNNEDNRYTSNVHVSERALREIYLTPFKAAVDAGAWAVMPAYNLFEDRHCCENPRLIRDILKTDWGFDGVAVSDWGGVYNTDEVIEGGLDIEMGTGTDGVSVNMNAYDTYHMANPYLERLRDGKASMADLDDRVRRVLRLIFRTSMAPSHRKGRFTCPQHYATARKIGSEGIVLLKNNGILPLRADLGKILVVGENAVKMMTVGGGSASLKVQREVSPLAGLRAALKEAQVDWERGYIGVGSTEFDNVKSRDSECLREDRTPEQLRSAALAKARDADAVIFIGGLNHSLCQDAENSDRKTLQLPYGQDELIADLAGVNPNLIVVNVSGTPVTMPWADRVAAVMQAWYLGSESGNSLADVLTGKVNPSGKLPFTFPRSMEDLPTCGERRYPGIKRPDGDIFDIYYDEDILIGYRWYDKQWLPVLFPFGFGLSYTDFELKTPEISDSGEDSLTLTLDVVNTGDRDGAETVQVYAAFPETKGLVRENKKLVGFEKVDLKAGERGKVSIAIPKSALAYYDEKSGSEVIAPGKYRFLVGNSSATLPHIVSAELSGKGQLTH